MNNSSERRSDAQLNPKAIGASLAASHAPGASLSSLGERVSTALVDLYFPAPKFNYETRKSIQNLLSSKCAGAIPPEKFISRAFNTNSPERRALAEMARSQHHTDIADFLAAPRWKPFSDLDKGVVRKPSTRDKIYNKTLTMVAESAKTSGLALAGGLLAAGGSKGAVLAASKILAACGIAVSGASLTGGFGSVAVGASLGLVGFSVMFHKIPNAVFSRMSVAKLFPINAAWVCDEVFKLIDLDISSREEWAAAGVSPKNFLDWVNDIDDPAKARSLSKASVKEALEICLADKFAAAGAAGARELSNMRWDALAKSRNIPDSIGWALVDGAVFLGDAWRGATRKLDSFNFTAKRKAMRAMELSRLSSEEEGSAPTPAWLSAQAKLFEEPPKPKDPTPKH